MNEKDKNMLIEESKDPQSLEGLKGQQESLHSLLISLQMTALKAGRVIFP